MTYNEVENFIRQSFIKIEDAFSTALADQCRALLWQTSGVDCNALPGELAHELLRQAANTPVQSEGEKVGIDLLTAMSPAEIFNFPSCYSNNIILRASSPEA